MFGKQTIFQVNDCLTNDIIRTNNIIVLDTDEQVLLQWHRSFDFIHPSRKQMIILQNGVTHISTSVCIDNDVYVHLLSEYGVQCVRQVFLVGALRMFA
jgi:hypothetical protein